MSSAPVVFARTIILKPAHLVALSCLYCSLLVTALTCQGLYSSYPPPSPDLHVPCRILRLWGFSCCKSLSSSQPICCHVKPLRRIQPTSSVILWTMAMSAWCRRSSRVWAPPALPAFQCTPYSLVLTPSAFQARSNTSFRIPIRKMPFFFLLVFSHHFHSVTKFVLASPVTSSVQSVYSTVYCRLFVNVD